MPLRPTPLLGFKPPFVKDGEIVLPVLTGSGDWAELHATPATWQRIGLALALHWSPAPRAPKPELPRCIAVKVDETRPHDASARTPITKPNGRLF